jgi:carboxypeptidase D
VTAYYNAGSAALVLVLIFLVIGLFVWCRVRRKRVVQLPTTQPDEDEDEENIPLNPSSFGERQHDEISSDSVGFRGKGKERSRNGDISPPEEPPIFEVGDSDDEEEYKKRPGGAKDV